MYTFGELLHDTSEAFELLEVTWFALPAPIKLTIYLSFGGMMLLLLVMMFRR